MCYQKLWITSVNKIILRSVLRIDNNNNNNNNNDDICICESLATWHICTKNSVSVDFSIVLVQSAFYIVLYGQKRRYCEFCYKHSECGELFIKKTMIHCII